MSVVDLPKNFITPQDKIKLESYAAYEISHGRATGYSWKKEKDNEAFVMYQGPTRDKVTMKISHNQKDHKFHAYNKDGGEIVSGTLDHVMAYMDKKLAKQHGEY